MSFKKPTALIVLDGFGVGKNNQYNATIQANTPHLDAWKQKYQHTQLHASGLHVGLPENSIGNSEVGHMTIGCGRVIPQPSLRIEQEIEHKTFFENEILIKSLKKLVNNKKSLHLIGLLSDSNVHSHINHLFAYVQAAKTAHIETVYIHPILDGRDCPPQSAKKYLTQLEEKIKKFSNASIGSVHGRFYAMDRDNNWDRIEKSYTVLTQQQEKNNKNWQTVLEENYSNDISDEFIKPIQLDSDSTIKDGDGIIFFNFRPDRARQLTQTFTSKNFDTFTRKNIQFSFFITPVSYNGDIETTILFEPIEVKNTLTDILHKNNKTVFAIAETEKYAHVTYFFNGGRENPYKNETYKLVPSLSIKHYNEQPKMSAEKITETVVSSLQKDPQDFYLINYANADMVGHTGDMQATIKAIEFLDEQLKKLYDEIVVKQKGTIFITSDHGNAEEMFDENSGQRCTSHTTNKVPFLWIDSDQQKKNLHTLSTLSDVAPFILETIQLPVPKEML